MNRLKEAQCYLSLTLFSEADLEKCNEIADSTEVNAAEQFIDMIQSLTSRCNTTNKDLKNELRTKQNDSQQMQRLNSRKAVIDKTREDARSLRTRSDELKTWVANKAKELLGYE